MECVRVVGALSAEVNGLRALVVSVFRAGNARQVWRSSNCRVIDAISLLCSSRGMIHSERRPPE